MFHLLNGAMNGQVVRPIQTIIPVTSPRSSPCLFSSSSRVFCCVAARQFWRSRLYIDSHRDDSNNNSFCGASTTGNAFHGSVSPQMSSNRNRFALPTAMIARCMEVGRHNWLVLSLLLCGSAVTVLGCLCLDDTIPDLLRFFDLLVVCQLLTVAALFVGESHVPPGGVAGLPAADGLFDQARRVLGFLSSMRLRLSDVCDSYGFSWLPFFSGFSGLPDLPDLSGFSSAVSSFSSVFFSSGFSASFVISGFSGGRAGGNGAVGNSAVAIV